MKLYCFKFIGRCKKENAAIVCGSEEIAFTEREKRIKATGYILVRLILS